MHQGSPNAIDRSVGSRREESAPVAFRLRRAAACSDGGQRPKPGPSLHMRGTVRCLRPLFAVHDHYAGLPVTQCRPWPTEDVWSERTRCARQIHGRGKMGGAIPRGEFAPSDPCWADNPTRIGRIASVAELHPLLAAGASAARV